ncbi:hypothetical protein [Pandoraea anhela]|uniref:DUF5666 domain-containing protein n=1 Tax=Pandoraea anhela TaxID=2508295 RepID=A0A5E4ZAF4_9BURK|nr:hypothetical protein [Pandoraea anhela]VVE57647.1 hypothetical protein PAN31108_05229 [Pandoraea anhela]
MSMLRKWWCVFAAFAVSGSVFAQAPQVERIRGDIVSFGGDVLKVHRPGGQTVAVQVGPGATLSALKRIPLSDVKVGTYVGLPATSHKDGKMVASAVLVFPESARGTKEGHFRYDFGPTSTMTNANVETIVSGNNGQEMTVSYKGGGNTIHVPANVPVVTFAPATQSDLVPGKKVVMVALVRGQGMIEAQVLFVEKDGVVPPL